MGIGLVAAMFRLTPNKPEPDWTKGEQAIGQIPLYDLLDAYCDTTGGDIPLEFVELTATETAPEGVIVVKDFYGADYFITDKDRDTFLGLFVDALEKFRRIYNNEDRTDGFCRTWDDGTRVLSMGNTTYGDNPFDEWDYLMALEDLVLVRILGFD